jgi:hypothetical protein
MFIPKSRGWGQISNVESDFECRIRISNGVGPREIIDIKRIIADFAL